MKDDPYVIPGTSVLKNKLGLESQELLDRAERLLTTQRAAEHIPIGRFDLAHLQAIHKHLFQDVYEWAGELRTVEISKDGHQFQFCQYLETGMADIHKRIASSKYYRGSTISTFAEQVGRIIGDVNYCHPFRDGNGRTQLIYLQQLAAHAGHRLDLRRLDPSTWIDASKHAHTGTYDAMIDAICVALKMSHLPTKDKDLGRG